MESNTEVFQPVQDKNKDKKLMLILSILFDLIGMSTFTIPFLGEILDVFWALVSALLLFLMYKGSHGKVAALIGLVEEILLFGTDIIPTFTLTWIYNFILNRDK